MGGPPDRNRRPAKKTMMTGGNTPATRIPDMRTGGNTPASRMPDMRRTGGNATALPAPRRMTTGGNTPATRAPVRRTGGTAPPARNTGIVPPAMRNRGAGLAAKVLDRLGRGRGKNKGY